MKKLFLLIFISLITLHCHAEEMMLQLGDTQSEQTWVYLSGLIEHFNTPQELANRKYLDTIGKKIGIKFLAIESTDRCLMFNNQLCWPHNSPEETLETYENINKTIGDQKIAGFIGFSSGGFFLNKLAQYVSLDAPIISIGSAGYINDTSQKNKIYLLIGKEDHWHYQLAKEFHRQSKKTSLDVTLIEYSEGHVLPSNLVESLILKSTHPENTEQSSRSR